MNKLQIPITRPVEYGVTRREVVELVARIRNEIVAPQQVSQSEFVSKPSFPNGAPAVNVR